MLLKGAIKLENRVCKAKSIKFSTAETLELGYGGILREYGELSEYKLLSALSARVPPLDVSKGVLKQWILKYRRPDDAVSISGAEELETKYGSAIRHLVAENRTGYKLHRSEKAEPPAVCRRANFESLAQQVRDRQARHGDKQRGPP